jgi:hypothetical protein
LTIHWYSYSIIKLRPDFNIQPDITLLTSLKEEEMRKTLMVILAIMLPLALTGCGGSDSGPALPTPPPPTPSFSGDTSPAVINATNAQDIVDASMSISTITNAVSEAMSFLDYFDPEEGGISPTNRFLTLSETTGMVLGCGLLGGIINVTAISGNDPGGGNITGTFEDYVPYDPRGSSYTDCLSGVVIENGTMDLSVTGELSPSTGCNNASGNCDVGTESGSIFFDAMKIYKTGLSNMTFDGTILSTGTGNTAQFKDTTTYYTKMTDNTLGSDNETMMVGLVEVETDVYGIPDDTWTYTSTGTVYTPEDGVVTGSTLTPLTEVGSGPPIAGQFKLTSAGGSYLLINVTTNDWSADFNDGGSTIDATGPVTPPWTYE